MWNLKVQKRTSVQIETAANESNVLLCCDDYSSNSKCYVLETSLGALSVVDCSGQLTQKSQLRSDVVHMSTSNDFEGIIVVCENGDFVSYPTDDQPTTHNALKSFYGHDFKVVAASVSWEKDLCAIVVERSVDGKTRRFISVCFSNLAQIDSDPVEIGFEGEKCSVQSVNVGWGHKSTQFHGSAGKCAALKKSNDLIVDWTDARVVVGWRYDDQYVAVSSLDWNGVRRMFVYDRNGILYSRTDDLGGFAIKSTMCWKPVTHEHLACTLETADNCLSIGFFEKNGLEHGERLELSVSDVFHLSYCKSGELLAIGVGDKFLKSIVLYERTNYKWLSKQQCLRSQHPIHFLFNPFHVLRTHYVTLAETKSLLYVQTDYRMVYDTNDNPDRMHAVTAGDRVDLTPFGKMLVPPPMCVGSIKFSTNTVVNECFWLKSNYFILLTSEFEFHVFEIANELKSVDDKTKPRFEFEEQLAGNCRECLNLVYSLKAPIDETYYNFWLSNRNDAELINGVCLKDKLEGNRIIRFGFDFVDRKFDLAQVEVSTGNVCAIENEKIIDIAVDSADSTITLLSSKARFFNLTNDNAQFLCTATRPIDTFQVRRSSTGHFLIFTYFKSLSELNVYSNNAIAHSLKCSSYLLSGDYLFLTMAKTPDATMGDSSSLRFLSLSELSVNNDLSESYRFTETGSQIILTIPAPAYPSNLLSILLQMPRGNIELVTPRFLAINHIIELLNKHEFKEAFDMVNRHRIDANLLCDYNLHDFLNNCAKFIEQLADNSSISAVICSLTNENCLINGKYGNFAHVYKEKNVVETDRKIKVVCDRISEVICLSNWHKRLSCLINCDIRSADDVKLGISKALFRLSECYNGEETNWLDESFKTLFQQSSYSQISADDLVSIAIGTYDLQIALMVINKTGQDPKKYLQLLNKFKEFSVTHDLNYMRYQIDLHLHRFKQALGNLLRTESAESAEDEIVGLVDRKALWAECIRLLAESDDPLVNEKSKGLFKRISGSYGEAAKNMHQSPPIPYSDRLMSAGLILARANLMKEASECFKFANNFRAKRMLSILVGDQRDVEDCSQIRKALSVGESRKEFQLWVDEQSDRLGVDLDDLDAELVTLDDRITKARREQYDRLLNSIDENTSDLESEQNWLMRPFEESDASSSYCTGSTISSQRSSLSTSSRRKKEKMAEKMRKRLTNLDVGSKFEDIALATGPLVDRLNALNELIEKTHRIAELLLLFRFDDSRVFAIEQKTAKLCAKANKISENAWLMNADIEENESITEIVQRKLLLRFYSHLKYIDPKRRFPPPLKQLCPVAILHQ